MAGEVPEQHKPQILAYLACTGRCDATFVSFDPRLPESQQLFIVEWTPEPGEIARVEAAAVAFLDEVDAMFRQLTESA